MKKLWNLTGVVLIGLALSSCSKDEETSTSYTEDYRFFLQAEINGQPLELKAGTHEYYLETGYQLEDDVLLSWGTLAPEGNTPGEALKIIYRGPELLQYVSQFNPDSSLSAGPVSFRDASSYRNQAGHYKLHLSIDSNVSISNPTWTLPDGSVLQNQISPTVSVNSANYPVFPIQLSMSGPGCQSSITHHVDMYDDCKASFDVYSFGTSVLRFVPKVNMSLIHNINWFIDNQAVELESDNTLPISLQNTTSLNLRAEFTFNDGCEKTVEREFFPQNDYCLPEFSAYKTAVKVHDEHQLGTVELIYFDKNGEAYTSFYEHVVGQFRVLATTAYQENDAGQHTTRFFFETDVMLKNASGDTLRLKDAYGSFAVAHP